MSEHSRLEILLQRNQWITGGGLVAITALAWIYLLGGAGMTMNPFDMTTFSLVPYQNAGMPVDMPGMNIIDHEWSPNHWIITLMMWWIMMIAMMLPGAAPVILLYARIVHHTQKISWTTHTTIPVTTFVSGYLFSWLMFSIFATILHWLLSQNNWLSLKMITTNGWLSASLLIAVGIYQLTPLKKSCLKYCQSPAEFISRHMKNGYLGAFRMGIEHGFFCVGCCWLMMLLLFVGGVMNLLWIAVLTVFVLLEKILSQRGQQLSKITGYALLLWGSAIFTTLL